MKYFQGHTTFVTSAGVGIKLDVEHVLLDEVVDLTEVNVPEETLKANMDDQANGSKIITNSIYHFADVTTIQETIQQSIDRFGNEQIDCEISDIDSSVQSPRLVHAHIHENCDNDPYFLCRTAPEKIGPVRQAEIGQVIKSSIVPAEVGYQVPSEVRAGWAYNLTQPEREAITKLRFCEIHNAFGAIEE